VFKYLKIAQITSILVFRNLSVKKN